MFCVTIILFEILQCKFVDLTGILNLKIDKKQLLKLNEPILAIQ
jgi:hypothetical protein